MNLSGQQQKKLQDALIDAFPTKSSLEQMLLFELDKNLDVITGEGGLEDKIFNLLKKAITENWIQELINAARNSNPGNPLLKAFSPEYLDLASASKIINPRYCVYKTISKKNQVYVFRAFDSLLARDVAIKILHSDKPESKLFFKEEVTEAVRLSQEPNFITIYDAYFGGDYYYYVMEFINGQTIRKYINDQHQFSLDDVCKIILKIGNALIGARELGLLHRNIKPSNILLVKNYRIGRVEYEPFISPIPLRIDLKKEQNPDISINQFNCYLEELRQHHRKEYEEELAYLIPEQFLFREYNNSKIEKATQYRLGSLAYELFTSKIPTTYKEHDALEEYQHFKLKPIKQKLPNFPKIMDDIILKMVSPKPEDRYENIEDALELIYRHIDFELITVKESYKRCAYKQDFDNKFFDSFYQKFINKCPHAREKFSNFDSTQNLEESKYWNRQHQLLKQAVLLLFVYFEENKQFSSNYYKQEEPNILSRIAEIHSCTRKNIPTNMYQLFIDALIETAIEFDDWCKSGDPELNRERIRLLKKAWYKVLKPGTDYMKSKYDENQNT